MNKFVCDNKSCNLQKSSKLAKCKECSKQYCSKVCMKQHKCKSNDIKELKPPLNISRKSSQMSRFIKPGIMLKELKNDPLYNFLNFEIVKIGKNPQILGNGLYGDIFLAKNRKNNKLYAIKQV